MPAIAIQDKGIKNDVFGRELFTEDVVRSISFEEILANDPFAATDENGNQVGGTITGATVQSDESGGRVMQDRDLFICYSEANTQVFRVDLSGANVGDVTMGNYAGGAGAQWDQSAGTFTILGVLTASEIHIPNRNTTANSFHVNTAGNSWWGATETSFLASNDNATAYVLSTGVAKFQSVTVTGTNTTIYGLGSGTPSASPNNGLAISTGATPGLIIYEGTAKRVELGYLSAGVFGLRGYATNGTTVIFELSDTRQQIAGFAFTDTQMSAVSGGNTTIVSSGSTAFTAGPTGSPTFTVTQAGVVTATSGTIGGWTLGTSTFTGGNAVIDSAGDFTLGTSNNVIRLSATDATYRIWVGHATASAAPFSVTKDGILKATNAQEFVITIPSGGNVPGVTITQNDTVNNPVLITGTQNGTGDILNLFDGVTEIFTILDGGNVGINAPTPLTRLDVRSTAMASFANTTRGNMMISGVGSLTQFSVLDFGAVHEAAPSIVARIGVQVNSDGSKMMFGTSNSYGTITNTALTIDKDGKIGFNNSAPSSGIDYVSAATTFNSFEIVANSLTTGSLFNYYSNSADTNTRYLITAHNDNAAAVGCITARLIQDSVANALFIDHNGNGISINIDPENTSQTTINVEADVLTTGGIGRFYSNSADTSFRNLLIIHNDNASATGTSPLTITQDADYHCLLLGAAGGGAHLLFTGDPANTTPADGELWYTGSELNLQDGATTRDLLDAWVELGETTLGSGNATITVSSIPARLDLRIVVAIVGFSATIGGISFRFNDDSGTNYEFSSRSASGPVSNTNNATAVNIPYGLGANSDEERYIVIEVMNRGTSRKMFIARGHTTTDSGDAGETIDLTGFWDNSSDQVTRFDVTTGGATTFDTGSRVTVYGKRN